MEDRIFISSQVANIIGITSRKVLSWTEKGAVIPYKESMGTGIRREYNYVNLLEFGLCKTLFSIGVGFRSVKLMVNGLRSDSVIRDWSNDFQNYYQRVMELQREAWLDITDKIKANSKTELDESLKEYHRKFLQKPYKPSKPQGILVYFFSDEIKVLNADIYPWEMDYVINLNKIKEGFTKSKASILIDIGKIKEEIDQKL